MLRTTFTADKDDEWFDFGIYRFNITRAQQHIAAGDVKFTRADLNIKAYAESMLAMRADKPLAEPAGIMMRVDWDVVKKMPIERLDDPLILAVIPKLGGLYIDGNHRIVRAYREGRFVLPVNIVEDVASVKKLSKPLSQRALKGLQRG